MADSISGKASLEISDKVMNSFIVSIYTFPQIIPPTTFKSLNKSGVTESKKYPITTLFLPISILSVVSAITALPKILNGLSFFCAIKAYKTFYPGFRCFSITDAFFL